ncbi:NUDIX hydrolase domain-like protein [Peziza echinospora]|nr:NUDIX hydrolase domain-like protein [Peziza echinospora]
MQVMTQTERTMEARTGRSKQRYSPDGSRLVCGVVALSDDKRKILVVESTHRKNHWVLPKGGYETDEATPEDAALREAWEEAGITGHIVKCLGEIPDPRLVTTTSPSTPPTTPPSNNSAIPQGAAPTKIVRNKSLFIFFEVGVDREESHWPEMHKRTRRWLTFDEASKCFEKMGRPELLEAVKRSSVLR